MPYMDGMGMFMCLFLCQEGRLDLHNAFFLSASLSFFNNKSLIYCISLDGYSLLTVMDSTHRKHIPSLECEQNST